MTIQRSAPVDEDTLAAMADGDVDYPGDADLAAGGRLARKRAVDWHRRIQGRNALVSRQIWKSLAQRMAGISYLAEALAERMLLENPGESQQAKHIAQLSADAVREACRLAKTLAPNDEKQSLK
ncbi:MAG: hypothetical protein NTV86_08835 [Planctomycetota bacterium]|nr:hypothetical protein [Planctomycetota bacterium]